MVPELMVKNGPLRFQFHNTTGSPRRAKSPHKRAMGGMRRCMFRARSSDLSVVKEPWNLSNAQTSAPISNNGGLVNEVGMLPRQSGDHYNKNDSRSNDSGKHDDEHGLIMRVFIDD
jgi:hypothetical protein